MSRSGFLMDYAKLASGSVGRLVIALAYFLVAANVLSLADFGLFATASALGVILSRAAGFGFISPLFRAATVKPQLIGTYLAGFMAALALSLPVVAGLALAGYFAVLQAMPWHAFALIIIAEVLGWRLLEVVAIINNGRRHFGRASTLVLTGSLIRTLAALAFWALGQTDLNAWSAWYLGANLLAAALAWSLFLPPLRWRFAPRLYRARLSDAMAAAAADIVFYVQAELDKTVVLAAAGPRMAGLYAIAMRIIDLTGMPVRVFNQLAMQKLMTARTMADSRGRLVTVEAGIAIVSVVALAGVIAMLWLWPHLLGRNVATAAALFPLLIAVPAFRNLVEYHAELLYGLGRTELRAVLLASLAAVKGLLLWLVIRLANGADDWLVWVNGVFFALWALSALTTYRTLRSARPPA
ncbi:MAG: lipopolysaccharide biosynthesis protein [Hyphomicrobiales bacterium]|nr:lipopolysaccharide biosynthesis protein [Hyphomicrobiales bacterium]